MLYFIDCEFDGFKGPLLSMAIVAEDGREFYWRPTTLIARDPWVTKNVLPVMDTPVPTVTGPLYVLQNEIRGMFYLKNGELFDGAPTLVADWPRDIYHFLEVIDLGTGEALKLPNITAKIIRTDPYDGVPESEQLFRHNALADARQLRRHFRS